MTWLCTGQRCTNLVEADSLCEDCIAYLPVVLAELPELWTKARSMLATGGQGVNEKVTVSFGGSRPPLHVGVLDALDTTTGVLVGWVTALHLRLAKESGTDDRQASILRSLKASCAYLSSVHHELKGTSLHEQLYNDIYRSHRTLRLIAGTTPEVERLVEPCPTCGNVALMRRRTDDYVRCLTCSGWWGQSAYRAILMSRASRARIFR